MPVQRLDNYSLGAATGACFVCGSSQRDGEPVLDFFRDVESLNWASPSDVPGIQAELSSGELNVCSSCVVEAARLLSMITEDQYMSLLEERAELKTKLEKALARITTLESALDAMFAVQETAEDVE